MFLVRGERLQLVPGDQNSKVLAPSPPTTSKPVSKNRCGIWGYIISEIPVVIVSVVVVFAVVVIVVVVTVDVVIKVALVVLLVVPVEVDVSCVVVVFPPSRQSSGSKPLGVKEVSQVLVSLASSRHSRLGSAR